MDFILPRKCLLALRIRQTVNSSPLYISTFHIYFIYFIFQFWQWHIGTSHLLHQEIRMCDPSSNFEKIPKCCLMGPETRSQDEQPVAIIPNCRNHVNQIWPQDTWAIVRRTGGGHHQQLLTSGAVEPPAGQPRPSLGSPCLVTSNLTTSANTSSSLQRISMICLII